MPLSEQRQELYCAIGEAITSWAAVEDRLADIFAYFVTGDGNSFPAKAAFHAVVNFREKLAMTDDAAEWRITGADLARWKTIFGTLGGLATQRNKIVHFTLIRSRRLPRQRTSRYYLSPSLQNVTAHMRGVEPPKLSAKDITQRAQGFRTLATDLSEFAVAIGATPQEPLPEFLAQLERNRSRGHAARGVI
jgi:hypothetical protein